MPVKPPGAPDHVCDDCGHMFKAPPVSLPALLLKKRKKVRCPKCGSRNVGKLVF